MVSLFEEFFCCFNESLFQIWITLVKTAGIIVITCKVSVIGVVLMDGAVEKIGLEMDVMVLWVEKTIIFVY